MPHPYRERPGSLTAVPDDVTDPLLWRLAIDVLAAHQPGQDGNCRNLQCTGQIGTCAATTNARRAVVLSRAAVNPFDHPPVPLRTGASSKLPARGREDFVGWFMTRAQAAPAVRLRASVPRRMPSSPQCAA